MSHDKDSAPSASELMVARDAALDALAWSTPTGCDVRSTQRPEDPTNVEADPHRVTSLESDTVCYYCASDCECPSNGWTCRTQAEQVADGHPDNGGPLTSYHDNPSSPTYYLPEMMDGLAFYWDDDSKAAMLAELAAFVADEANGEDLHGLTYEQIGHDFTLTRNGHGTGFWDRGLGDRGDRLTAATKPYGEAYMYADFEHKTYKLGA